MDNTCGYSAKTLKGKTPGICMSAKLGLSAKKPKLLRCRDKYIAYGVATANTK